MVKEFLNKIKESLFSVLPIVVLVTVLAIWIAPMTTEFYITFAVSAVLLVVGMALFNHGADNSMIEMGANVGTALSKTKKINVMLLCTFLIGFFITIAEPELLVASNQVGMGKWLFIIAVSLGVGVFLSLAIIKMIFKLNLSFMFAASFTLLLILSYFINPEYLPLIFDAGSITTSSISVPFLLSFGVGLASLRMSKSAEDDTFGLIALSSVGPMFSVMLLSAFLPSGLSSSNVEVLTNTNLLDSLIGSLIEVTLSLLPIIIIFFLFQFFTLKLPVKKIIKICIGLAYTFIGIVIFLTGVGAGFLPVAFKLGTAISTSVAFGYKSLYLLIPLSLILGFVMISAEPAIHVLKRQVEEITQGKIKERTMLLTLSIGSAIGVLLASLRTVFDIPILFLMIPIYLPCIILTFINPKVFTAIAFDSGGSSTGAMGVSFVLPMFTGLAGASGNAFGTIGLMSAMAVLSIQILGLVYTLQLRKQDKLKEASIKEIKIIDFDV